MSKVMQNYVSLIQPSHHVMLFYDDDENAKKIRVEFIKQGLEKGQRGIYLTTKNDVDEIKEALSEQGIDINKLESQNKFLFFVISDPITSSTGFEGTVTKVLKKILELPHTTTRIAFNVLGTSSRFDDKARNAYENAEKILDKHFKSGNYILCTLKVDSKNLEAHKKNDKIRLFYA